MPNRLGVPISNKYRLEPNITITHKLKHECFIWLKGPYAAKHSLKRAVTLTFVIPLAL